MTWAQKAKLEARNIETSLVNLKMLKESLPEIRSMTTMGGSILLQAKPSQDSNQEDQGAVKEFGRF